MTVVVVAEDDADLRLLIVRAFSRTGYDVIAAADGPSALAAARDTAVRAVALDVCLPGMSGLQVCRRLRAEAHGRHVMISIFSADIRDGVRESAFAAGADRFLAKPFRLHELTGPVAAALAAEEDLVTPWLAADLAGRATLGYALDAAVPAVTEATA